MRASLVLVIAIALAGCGDATLASGDGPDRAADAATLDVGTPDPDASPPDTAAPDPDADASPPDPDVSPPDPDASPPDPDAAAPDATPPEPAPPDPAPPEPAPPADDCPRVRVSGTGDDGLNVRPDPSTARPPVGHLAEGAVAAVTGVVEGEAIRGDTTWFAIERGDLAGFVSGVFVACLPPGGPDDDEFLLPLACGSRVRISQGNDGAYSHNGRSRFAFDFSIGLDTPLLAMRAGRVAYRRGDVRPGDRCYSGGGPDCAAEVNYVVVEHADGTQTQYAHMNRVDVDRDERVERGQHLGLSGGTGYSTGPHAHVARQRPCGGPFCESIPLSFADVPGDGVPATGDVVVSANGCP